MSPRTPRDTVLVKMARPNSSADTGAAAATPHRVVFVDTNVDTHLAIAVSHSDTVSDFKKKIIQAHVLCFPELGDIKIDAVKVKRRGHSYHLFDSMLVASAFNGVKKDWFLSVDASSSVECLPLLVIADGTPSAIVEIGGSSDVHETVGASENAAEGLQNLMVGVEGAAVNSSGETMMPDVPNSKLRNEDSPSENPPSKKRRKMEKQASDAPNSADATLPSHEKAATLSPSGRTMEVENGGVLTEPEKAIVETSVQATSSEAFGRVALHIIEKADDGPVCRAVKHHEKDMNVVAHLVGTEKTVDKIVSPKRRKRNRKPRSYAGEELKILNPENYEASHGNDSLVESQQAVNYDKSGNMLNDKKNLSEVDENKESGEEHGIETGPSPEIINDAEFFGEKTENNNKIRTAMEKIIDQTSDRPEQEQSNQLEEERNETAVMDGNEKSSEEHRNEKGLSREIAENAENILEKTKKRAKRRSSNEKGVDQTSDRCGRVQSDPSKAEGKEIGSVAPDQNSDKEPMDEMGSLKHVKDKAVFEVNVKEKVMKKKTRKWSSKEKDEHSGDIIGIEESLMSQAKGRDMLTPDADGKERGNERVQMLQVSEKLADSGNLREKTKMKTARRGSKEKNAVRINDKEANYSQTGEAETVATVAADSKNYEQSGNEIKESCQVTKNSVPADIGKDKRKKTRRQSPKEKDANQFSNGIDKEASFFQAEGRGAVVTVAAESESYEPSGNKMEQLCDFAEKSLHADIGKEKRNKKTATLSSWEENADQPRDKIDGNQNYVSEVEWVGIAANEKSEGKQGIEGPSQPQITENPANPDNNDQKTQEQTKKWGSMAKDIDQSSDITGKKEESHYQGTVGKDPTVVNADKSSNWDHAGNNVEKGQKTSKGKQRSRKRMQSNRKMKDLSSSHSTAKEDISNLGGLAETAIAKNSEAPNAIAEANSQDLKAWRMVKVASGPTFNVNSSHAPVQSSEANNQGIPPHEVTDNLLPVGHSDEANSSVGELHGRGNINFRDYFVSQRSQQEVAAPDNSLIDKGTKENRAGSKLKVRNGKRKAASSALTGLLQLNEQTCNEKSPLSNSDKLASPVKLSKTPGSGSQASMFPKAKTMEFYVNPEKDSENSAASVSGLKRSKKPKKTRKSNSNVDHFRVAIREPSNKNMGESVDNSQRKKSLLSLVDAIFKEESSGSSKHDAVENSDASIRTPSDSLFSDYSDSDSNVNLNTVNDGSRRDGGHSKGKSSLKDVKSLSMDRILRSSSGFKKARLAAASQLDDGQSQPDEFVPDSQPNID